MFQICLIKCTYGVSTGQNLKDLGVLPTQSLHEKIVIMSAFKRLSMEKNTFFSP